MMDRGTSSEEGVITMLAYMQGCSTHDMMTCHDIMRSRPRAGQSCRVVQGSAGQFKVLQGIVGLCRVVQGGRTTQIKECEPR